MFIENWLSVIEISARSGKMDARRLTGTETYLTVVQTWYVLDIRLVTYALKQGTIVFGKTIRRDRD